MVANGSGRFGSGVKIRIVGPDHLKVPAAAGAILTNGARTTAGIRPSSTIGSENTTRISLASASAPISPVGPVLTTVSGGVARAACPASRVNAVNRRETKTRKARFMAAILDTSCGGAPTGLGRVVSRPDAARAPGVTRARGG